MRVTIAGTALLAAAVVALVFWAFTPSVPMWSLPILWLALTVPAVLSAAREGTLVALREENRIFVEWRNTVTRRKRRTLAARLTDLTGYEVRSFVDIDSDMFPHPICELRLAIGGKSVLCYCDSREIAEKIGEHLLGLRNAA